MESDSNRQSAVPITSAIVLALAVAGVALIERPIESDRDAIRRDAYAFEQTGIERVHASLWQDPLLAVMARRDQDSTSEGPSADATDLEDLRHEIARHLAEPGGLGAGLLVMPVLMSSDYGPEVIEDRRRQRLAVVSAMGSRHYYPEESQLIGYLEVAWDPFGCIVGPSDRARRIQVAFEWFTRDREDAGIGDAPTGDAALVLYVPEEELLGRDRRPATTQGKVAQGPQADDTGRPRGRRKGNPLTAIDQLARALVDRTDRGGSVQLAVIGPASSDTLKEMTIPPVECRTKSRGEGAGSLGDDEQSALPASRVPRSDLAAVLDDYLDDGLPDGTDRQAIRSAQERFTAMDPFPETDTGDWRRAVYRLTQEVEAAMPGVKDRDPFWSQTSVALWLGVARKDVPPSPAALAELLLVGAELYLDAGLSPDVDREALGERIAGEIRLLMEQGFDERPAPPQKDIAAILGTAFEGVRDSDPQWYEHVARVWHETFVEPVAAEPLPTPPRPRTYEALVQDYLGYLDHYLDAGLPDWVRRRELLESITDLLEAQADAAFETPRLDDDQFVFDSVREKIRRTLEVQRIEGDGFSIVDRDPNWLENTLASWFDFVREARARRLVANSTRRPSLLPGALIVSGRATDARPRSNGGRFERCAVEHASRLDSQFAAIEHEIWRITHSPDGERRGARFVSVTPSDLQLTHALAREAIRRGVDPSRDHIVVVSERDTTYGRSLPGAMECGLTLAARGERPKQYHRFTYLSGIDGVVPRLTVLRRSGSKRSFSPSGDSGSDRSAGSREPRSAVPSGAFELLARAALGSDESAVGTRRFDAIRRLTRDLRAMDRESGGRVAMVAVLGSDAYDKEIIIQALRPELPDAVFATTDLDARFLEARATSWSRNLVVASAYGLQLHPDYQLGFPPFRDSYQTSTFVSVAYALDDWKLMRAAFGNPDDAGRMAPPAPVCPIPARLAPRPRLFELGLASSAVELDVLDDEPNGPLLAAGWGGARLPAVSAGPSDSGCPDLHPTPASGGVPWTRIASFGALILVVILLARPLSSSIHMYLVDHDQLSTPERRLGHVLIVVSAVVFLGIAAAILFDRRGEPFEWWLGLSAWPTQIIRGGALVLSIGLCLAAYARVRRNTQLIREQYGLDGGDGDEVGDSRGGWVRSRSVQTWLGRARRASGTTRPLHAIWREYLDLGRPANRLIRTGGLFAVTCVLIALAQNEWPMYTAPLRSRIGRLADLALLWPTLLAVVVLTLLVVDASRLCRAFVGWLAEVDARWEGIGKRGDLLVERFGLSGEDGRRTIEPLLTVELIARRTEGLGHVLTYPFLVGGLLYLSQLRVFDAWSWPPAITILLVILIVFALVPAFTVRRAAERARRRCLDRLREMEAESYAIRSDSGASERRAAQVRLVADAVESMEFGAFAPWRRHALLGAVLIPFGGLGLIALVDVAAMFGLL